MFTNLSISDLRGYYFLFTITLGSRGRGGGLTKRLREKGYYRKDILDLTVKCIRGVLLTKGDSRVLERITLMDTDTAEFANMSKFPFNLERVHNYGFISS